MDLTEQLSIKILQKLTLEIPQLEVDMPKQLQIKNIVHSCISEYEVTSRCTDLVVSDMGKYIDYFIACKRLKGLSKSTLKNYYVLLNSFNYYCNKPIRMIRAIDIRLYMDKVCGGNSPNVINNKIIIINNFFDFLKDEEIITSNPVARVEKMKVVEEDKKPFTVLEQELLRKSCKSIREKLFIEILLSTGMRVGELSNLKISDIDFNDRKIFIRKAKGGKTRDVIFSTRAMLLIYDYMNERKGDGDYLFISENKPYNKLGIRGMQHMMKRIGTRSGIETDKNIHKLRRTMASNLVNKGIGLPSISKLLGHSNIQTSSKFYCKVSYDTVRYDYNKVYE